MQKSVEKLFLTFWAKRTLFARVMTVQCFWITIGALFLHFDLEKALPNWLRDLLLNKNNPRYLFLKRRFSIPNLNIEYFYVWIHHLQGSLSILVKFLKKNLFFFNLVTSKSRVCLLLHVFLNFKNKKDHN